MNKNRILHAAATAAMGAGMILTSVSPVFAAGKDYAPINGTSTTFEKTIELDNEANVPNVTYSYGVAGGTAIAGDGSTKLNVFAGNDGVRTNGLPTIADITFAAGDTDGRVNGSGSDQGKIVKTATMDFSGVSFKEPGVYRYNVTESGAVQGVEEKGTVQKADGSTEAVADRTFACDVYVEDDGTGTLQVVGYVLHNDESADAAKLDSTIELGDKITGLKAVYTTSDLTISKTVTGNQGSRDEYFPFTVTLTGAVKGSQFNVDLSGADATTVVTPFNADTHENPAMLTAGEDGNVTQRYWLRDGQSIVIRGIAGETAYSISEAENAGDVGYTTSIITAGDTMNGDTDIAAVDGKDVADGAITADTTSAYTNHKSGAIPTGVVMAVGGAGAVTLLGGVGLATIMMKRKKEDKE